MNKARKAHLSAGCFIVGFACVLLKDLSGFSTLSTSYSYSVPWTILFYAGLVLLVVGYVLKE